MRLRRVIYLSASGSGMDCIGAAQAPRCCVFAAVWVWMSQQAGMCWCGFGLLRDEGEENGVQRW